ncbi:MAG: hypothetical protein K2W95_15395 [Candidatus Obscuribacterales bacterium]|nr:hypothetical protein [Candidatus Obscuribacterales bacterium]
MPAAATGHKAEHHQAAWWKVGCLTGVDYFSTLGYQPGIAILAAGFLAPIATLVLVLLTLFGALPIYRLVAERSPQGQGSISMLERLLPGWIGKFVVLGLIGFCATDFIITITLSSADAAAHIVQNPLVGQYLNSPVLVTLGLVLALGGMFLWGFREVLGIAVALVIAYLGLNAVVIVTGLVHVAMNPEMVGTWTNALATGHNGWTGAVIAAALVFPRLALGFSGFETGVAVMPQVEGAAGDTEERPVGRVANTKKLLMWSACIMAVYLLLSSLVTTWLIPAELVHHGGEADGRALSYLAHKYLGHGFGTVYDVSTVLILWFAGASAMAGLINLVPRYLPRYGMAPEWTKATRPLVIFFTVVACVVTVIFEANVEAQGGAYATGVLVLITSAALAVCLTSRGILAKLFFGLITLVFIYTTAVNIIERPDGLKVASFFIGTVLATSLLSRWLRSMELRHTTVYIDSHCKTVIEQAIASDRARQESRLHDGGDPDKIVPQLRLLAHRPGGNTEQKLLDMQSLHGINPENVILLEVTVREPSEFATKLLHVTCTRDAAGHYIFHCESAAVPNAIAGLLLMIQELYAEENVQCHAYFGWSEKRPALAAFEFLLFGVGEVATLAREILRRAVPDVNKRPRIHVG